VHPEKTTGDFPVPMGKDYAVWVLWIGKGQLDLEVLLIHRRLSRKQGTVPDEKFLDHFARFRTFGAARPAAVFVAALTHAPQTRIDQLASIFVLLRVVYTALYVADQATLRSIVWSLGLIAVLWLFVLGVKRLALAHVGEIEAKIAELSAMRDTVRELVAACDGDHRPDCPILHDLETGGTIMSSDLQ
jgi:hypothetical protein